MQSAVYRDVKDVAKDIRRILKVTFPDTTFSVRIDRFSGGSSCDVYWIDGPTETQVGQALQSTLESDKGRASYEPYGDYWNGSHYYDLNRDFSASAYRWAVKHIVERYPLDFQPLPEYEVREYEHHTMKGRMRGSFITDSFSLSVAVYRELQGREFF